MHVNNFFVCGPKFTNFFSPNVGGVVVDELLFRFTILDTFRRYLRSKSKVVRNRAKFWTVFSLPNSRGRPPKNCTHVITPGSRHVVWIKICDDIFISSEVIDVHTLNFKPNFKFSRLNFFLGGDPRPSLPKNVHLGGSICTSITSSFVDQSSRSFFHRTWEGL